MPVAESCFFCYDKIFHLRELDVLMAFKVKQLQQKAKIRRRKAMGI